MRQLQTLGRIAAFMWLTGVVGVAPVAAAQPPPAAPSSEARALDLFDEGAVAFEEQRYFDAIRLFLDGDAIAPSPAFAYNIALAYQQVGDPSHALRWARAYLRRAGGAEGEAADEMRQVIVASEARLKAHGIQQVTVRTTPPGATVTVDGEPLGVTPWTGELGAGEHRLRLTLMGYAPQERSFTLELDHAREWEFELTEADVRPPEPAPEPDRKEASPALLISSIALLGVGLGGLGAGLGLELERQRAEEEALDASTQVQALEQLEARDDYQLGSRIAFVAGGALVAAGVTMLIVDLVGSDEVDAGDAPQAGAFCDPTGCAGSLRLWF